MNLITSFRYLIALKKHQHFSRAAQACHITQPGFSNALRSLEEHFDTTIVNRGHSFVSFTTEGELIVQSAERVLHELGILSEEIGSTKNEPHGVLRLGAIPTAIPIAARFAATLQARYPHIKPILLSLSSEEIEQKLSSFSIDLGLGYIERIESQNKDGYGKLISVLQYTERYFFLRRAQSSRTNHLNILSEGITWHDVAQVPLCLLTPDMHNRTVVDRAFASIGIQIKPVMETNSILTLVLSVLDGCVSSILPGALISTLLTHYELEALPIHTPEVLTPIGFLMSPVAESSRVMQVTLAFANGKAWQEHMQNKSGLLTVKA